MLRSTERRRQNAECNPCLDRRPNYNHAPTWRGAWTILAQTCQDFERPARRASTDASRDVLEFRDHPRSAACFNDANSGSTFSVRQGRRPRRGEYVWIAGATGPNRPSAGPSRHPQRCTASELCRPTSSGRRASTGSRAFTRCRPGRRHVHRDHGHAPRSTTPAWHCGARLYARIPRDFTGYRFCGDWLFWVELAQLGKVHISGRRSTTRSRATSAGVSQRLAPEELQVLDGCTPASCKRREYARASSSRSTAPLGDQARFVHAGTGKSNKPSHRRRPITPLLAIRSRRPLAGAARR